MSVMLCEMQVSKQRWRFTFRMENTLLSLQVSNKRKRYELRNMTEYFDV